MDSSSTHANTTQLQKRVKFEIRAQEVVIAQRSAASFEIGTGAALWDAGKVLAKYLEHRARAHPLGGKKVLELGAGCGLVSVTAAILGANVTSTDIPVMLPLLESNIAANRTAFAPSASCDVLPFEWGSDHSHLGGPFDVVLGSDVVFKETLLEPMLLDSWHLLRPGGYMVNVVEVRCEALFEQLQRVARKYFLVKRVPTKRHHPEYRSEYVAVFVLHRRAEILEEDSP
eukprot:TRINITY_DN12860_c0_g1_i1.p2 TRINITY_DN12860_c0_g1~~TRINITY_DN12860_c0_g1_i1.p2  ORF type:complete len:229 (-),score=65.33 TRINITY_DN12860_c0_g1_i1:133-819(-)